MIFFLISSLFMKAHTEYTWLSSYLSNDTFWLEDVLNWDDVATLWLADFNTLSFFFNAFFLSNHLSLDFVVKTSFLDLVLLNEVSPQAQPNALFTFFIWDIVVSFFSLFTALQFFFFTDFQDYLLLLTEHAPELILGLSDFLTNFLIDASFDLKPVSVFDTFNDVLNSSLSEFVEYLCAFFLFFWGLLFFSAFFRIANWTNALEVFLVRLNSYLFSASRELRLQLEAVYTLIFIFVLYVSMMIATFDDDQEELFEFFHGSSFYLFLAVFVYFLYKYSLHYFSFLEASEGGSRLVGLITQFAKDLANTFALSLRFGVLMLRLNIYDFLDDAIDSYYIFVCDFDDDEYFSELFFSVFSVLFFDLDNNDDRSFFFEDELDFSIDLFSLYFILWSKFSLFFFFAIEEVARVFLAFYIVYLIIFEIQAVNRSYVEDLFLFTKKV